MPEFDLPLHPRTGLRAIGTLRNGAPVWPALGGSEDDDDTSTGDGGAQDGDDDARAEELLADAIDSDEETGDGADSDDSDEDDKPLGAAGEKALQALKTRRKEEAARRRTAEKERDEALAELEKMRRAAERAKSKASKPTPGAKPADKPADEADVEEVDLDEVRREAREQAKAEARAEQLAERVTHRIEVLAAKRFQDAEDALAQLTRTHEVEDFLDGDKVDVEAIKEALDELLDKKPYLAVPAQGEVKRFKGSGDGGAKPNKPARPRSLHEAVTRKLSNQDR